MSKLTRIVFGILFVIIANNVQAQNLTISAGGQTGTSGTNWSTSGSNPVKIIFTGTADINKSVIEGILATDNVVIEAGTGGQGISITAAISNTSTKSLTIGAVSNTNAVTISAAISNAAEIILNGGLITVNSNLTISNTSSISLLAKSGLRFGNAGITIQTQGGDLILSSDYDANSVGNIISEGALTLTSNGGAIKLGGGPNAAGFAYGTAVTSINEVPGIWIKGAVNFNSGNGDISIKGFAAAGTPSTSLPAWGIGLGFGGTAYNTGSPAAVSINSGTGKIYVEGWGRNPNGPSGGSPSGILFNNWEGVTTQPLTITSANTTADAIKLIGNTENTANGQRYKNSIYFWSNASSIKATAAGGGITISGKTFVGNDHYQIFWSGGNILATSGPIVISTENNGFYVDGDLYIGSRNGVTGNTTSSSNIRFSVGNYAVGSGKLTRIATTGEVTIEPFGTAFRDYQSAVVPFSTATGWSFNENSQSISGLTVGKSGNVSPVTIGATTTVAGSVFVYGENITVDGNINTSAGNTNGDILLKGTGNIVQNTSKTITTNGGDVTIWADSDGNNDGMISLSSNVTTNGGHLWMGGGNGSATWNGLSVGNGFATGNATNSNGLVMTGSTLNTTGGNIAIYAKSRAGIAVTGVTGNTNGVRFLSGNTINSGTGTIYIKGYAQGTNGSSNGIEFSGSTADLITSANTTSDAIVLDGETVANPASVGDGWGIYGWAATIQATADGGGVSLIGKGSKNNGVTIPAAAAVLAKSGPIKLIGSGFGSLHNSVEIAGVVGAKTGTGVTVSSSNVEITGDTFKGSAGSIETTGQLVFESFGTSFSSAFSLSNINLSNALTGLTLGKATNTAGITIGSATTIAGPINLYGGALAINAALTATNNTVNLNATGAVTQTAAIVANNIALVGSGTFTLNNANNNVATIAAGDNTARVGNISLTDASGGLTIGTVGNKTGIQSTGTVLVETLVGDLTLSGNITTTNTTASAIILNAGKSTAIETTTGGNILVTGTPTLATGTGGIAKLFSGSDAGSTGLTLLVGGAANTRSGADETSTNYSPSLAANGKYALYRTTLQTVAPVISNFSPTTAGNGETVVITGTGFIGVTVVKFGNVNATSFTVDSDTQISAVVGAAASGDVYVQNASGNSLKAGFLFKVVEYKFEGNVLDQTDANLDGAVAGTVTYGTGASGQAICFTSSNVNSSSTVPNYLTLPNDLIKGRGSNFTISLRFKTNSFGAILGYQNAGVKNINATQYVPILYVQSDGKLSANLWQGFPLDRPLNVLSSNRVDDGNWHKVEFSAAPGSITVYIDGVSAGSSTGTIDHLAMSFNQLGAVNTAGVWTGDPIDGWFGFNGCIDEFIIIDKSLTATQIQQVTQLPLPVITSFTPTIAKSGETVIITGANLGSTNSVKIGGVAVRRFTVVSATEIRAIVPYNATVNSTIEVTTAGGTITEPAFTYDCTNNALDFDGVNDFIQVGSPLPITSTGNFTIEAWVKPSLIDANFHGFFGLETQAGRAPSLYVGPNGTLYADAYNSTNINDRYLSQIDNFFTLNTWVHVALVRNGNTFVIYKNGVQVGTRTAPTSVNLPNANFWIGRVDNYLAGKMDEVRVWTTARTAQQILSGMGTEFVGNESGLAAYYNFNQGIAAGTNTTINTINNLTVATNLDGTLTNMALTGATSNFIQGIWPAITTQPTATTTVCSGANVSLTVSAVGSNLSYQWYTNNAASNSGGTAITGATAATYTYTTSTVGSEYFYAVVTGACSQTTSTTVSTVTTAAAPAAPVVQTQTNYCEQTQVAEYKYAKIVFTGTKNLSDANSIQVSEWKWFNGTNEISRANVTVMNPGGNNPAGEAPQNIYDGSTATKWLDFNIVSGNNTSSLVFAFPGTGVRITGYSFMTANDSEERDPKSWVVYMSNDNVNWTVVHSLSNYSAPSGRNVASATWSYATASNPVILSATALANHTLKWYSVATGGISTLIAPSINTTSTGTFNYFVSQTNAAGCESPRATLSVIVNALPAAPVVANINYIRGATATALTATALANHTLRWYATSTGGMPITTAPIPSTVLDGTVYYYVSQINDATGCEGARARISVVTAIAAPAGLTYSTPNIFTVGTQITTLNPTSTGGAIANYSIIPNLPTGLIFNFNNGSISGTPIAASATTDYTITGTNASGSVTTTVTVTVAKANPTIASMAAISKTFGNPAFPLTVPTSNSNGAFTFTSSNTAVATILNNLVTIVGAGTATITATQAATANYNAGSVTATLTVAKANPTITILSNITRAYGSAAVTLVAPSSNSNGAFTYTISDASVATISGATLTAVGIGTATITTTQAESANYNAGSVTRTITVVKGTPTIGTFAAINKTFGDAAFTLTAPTSTSTGAFTYASDNTAVATVSGATVTIVGAGTANITATQAADANYNAGSVSAVLTVAKAARTLSAFADINKTTTDAPFTLVAPTSSAGTGAITYASSNTAVATVSGSNVTITGIGTSIITATQAADDNYLEATITATLTVILGDSDGDGVPDDVEIRDGTDPNNPSSVKDSDGDGVPDYVEIGSGTNPNSPADAIDSDGDGLSDYYEARNAAPTNIALSATTINENNTAGAAIVDITAIDVNIGETFTYALVAGTGDADNASFTINGSSLRAVNAFDFETRTTYSLRLKVTDKGGLSFEKEFVITIADVNDAPTNISLSANAVAENAASGTTVGTLAGTDADAAETFTYTLVSGTGDTDNASFTITGSTLRTAAVFDFETKNSYSVRVRVTDAGGLTFEKEFTISVTDINEAPTALALSNTSVLENAASGTTVGTLAGTDADAGDTHTYTLVSGTGSTDNASFTITGTTLSTAAVFNFEAKNSYAVRVRVTDAGGLTFERAFTISVTDVNEAPTLTAITDRRVYNVSTSQVVNLAGITAGPETAQSTTTTVSTDKPATFSSINVVGTQIQFTLAAGIVTPQDVVVTVRVKDNGGVANGGVDTLVRTFKLGIDPMPVAAASPNLITLGATAQLSAAGANAINYTWVAVGGSGIVGSGATINVRPKGTTTYAVVVTNSFGYQATIPVLLTVIVDYKLVPNNLITPNGDGVNDKWVIPNIDMYPDNEVMVYDKAGRVVFTKRGYNSEWDGTINGTKLKEDAYFYVIKFNKDGALPIRGYVSIVR
jgi:gliding motility-associated-like protein